MTVRPMGDGKGEEERLANMEMNAVAIAWAAHLLAKMAREQGKTSISVELLESLDADKMLAMARNAINSTGKPS